MDASPHTAEPAAFKYGNVNTITLFSDMASLLQYLQLHLGSEERNLEYKEGRPWQTLRLKIAKAALAMANLKGGGYIIVGVEDIDAAKKFNPVGISEEAGATYDKDEMTRFLNNYADPGIVADARTFSDDSRHFVVIQVSEFEDMPVICKKDGDGLRDGQMYVRPRRMAESVAVPSAAELRDVLENAVDKGITKQLERFESYERARKDVHGGEKGH